jgi:hypothetical protein
MTTHQLIVLRSLYFILSFLALWLIPIALAHGVFGKPANKICGLSLEVSCNEMALYVAYWLCFPLAGSAVLALLYVIVHDIRDWILTPRAPPHAMSGPPFAEEGDAGPSLSRAGSTIGGTSISSFSHLSDDLFGYLGGLLPPLNWPRALFEESGSSRSGHLIVINPEGSVLLGRPPTDPNSIFEPAALGEPPINRGGRSSSLHTSPSSLLGAPLRLTQAAAAETRDSSAAAWRDVTF